MIWRTPARLKGLRLRWRGVGLAIAAIVLVSVIGAGLSFGEEMRQRAHNMNHFSGVLVYFLGLVLSPTTSWLGYATCIPLAFGLIRRNAGGIVPMATLGALGGVILIYTATLPIIGAPMRGPHDFDPFLAALGGAVGATCMAVWWALAMTFPGGQNKEIE